MKITNTSTNTNVAEIGDGIFRINTPIPPNPALPTGFTFNQYLVVDDEPLLFHTGPRKLFPVVRDASLGLLYLAIVPAVAAHDP